MPYLKIKVANDGKDTDWTTINSLDLSTLNVNGTTTISGDTTISGNATINGNTTIGDAASDKLTINANVEKFVSTGTKDSQTQSVEISNGELKIQSPGDTARQSLSEYLNLNTSGCTVGDSNEPEDYKYWGKKKYKKGDLYIQLKVQNGTTYSLLWYCDEKTENNKTKTYWKHVHAIWG